MDFPVIGIPAYHPSSGEAQFVMMASYCRAIEGAAGAPILLPYLEDRPLRQLYDLLDGLLLSGGGDVAPELYGAQDSGQTMLVDRERDRVELLLTRWALAEGKPILGICRGVQVLNVAAGGTLIQHIPAEVFQALRHSTLAHFPPNHLVHEVNVLPGSLLAKALGAEANNELVVLVNSRHHQAVKGVAPGFRAVAWATDGVIEAIEREEAQAGFALGIQWHAENLLPDDPRMESLFHHYVAACRHRGTHD